MSETFDVGFEKYIIFHRGVQRMEFRNVEGAEHLFIVYQDGEEQDLGDPYGDGSRAAQAAAEEALAAAVAAKEAAETAQNSVDQTYADAIAAGQAAQARYEQATEKADEAIQKANEATDRFETLESTAVNTIHEISGIVEDPDTHAFYVELPAEVTDAEINNLFV